jgi:hypothetical protein
MWNGLRVIISEKATNLFTFPYCQKGYSKVSSSVGTGRREMTKGDSDIAVVAGLMSRPSHVTK